MTKRRKRANPWRVIVLMVLVGGALYVNQNIIPNTQPLFIPTVTPTRSPESFITDAEALVGQGKLVPAIGAYRLAIQANPKNGSLYVTTARLMVYTANYKEAVTMAENALLINPNNGLAHGVRGWALTYLEDYLPAEAAIKKSLELDPNNGEVYAYYAQLLALQNQAGQGTLGSLDKAVEASRKAITLSPNSLETHRARGLVLEMTSNYAEAAKEFESAITINGNISDLHLSLGRNYRALQQYDKAVEEFNRANALNPSDPMANTYISRTYAAVGEYAKAIQFAQQAVKVSSVDPFLYGNLGTMYYRNKQYKDAVTTLRVSVRGGKSDDGKSVVGLPLDYGRVAEYYYLYGLALARNRECGEALELSQVIQQGVINDETAVYNAGQIIEICKDVSKSGIPTSETSQPAETNTTIPETTLTPQPPANETPAP